MRSKGLSSLAALVGFVAILAAGTPGLSDAPVNNRTTASTSPAESPDAGPDAIHVATLWAQAVAHLRNDAPRAALPYLEELVSLEPGFARFRLELARTLFLIRDDTRARHHFERALGAPMALSEIQAVHQYLRAMDRRKTWEGSFSIAIVPESNALRQTSDEIIYIGGLPFLLMPDAQARPETGLDLSAGITWLPQLRGDLRWRLHAAASARAYSDSAINQQQLRLEAGIVEFGDRGRSAGAGVMGQLRYFGGAQLMRAAGVYSTWQGRVSDRTTVSLRGEAEYLQFPTTSDRDGPRVSARAHATHNASAQMQLHATLTFTKTLPETAHFRRRDLGLAVGAEYAFAGGLVAGVELSVGAGTSSGPDPLFAVTQSDTRMGISARAMHRSISYGGFAPVIELGFDRQDSNIPLYSHSNARLSLGLTRQF